MSLNAFFELVQLRAKINSVFPFLLGTIYAIYHYRSIHLLPLIIFLFAIIIFNMAIDAHDNYLDFKYLERINVPRDQLRVNIIAADKINLSLVNLIIYGFIVIAAVLGIIVAMMTGWPVLWLGLFSFAIGYFYQGGPYPIVKTPTGEFFSGFTMGSVIFLLAIYINVFDKVVFNWSFIWPILLASGLIAAFIANILLANSICDRDEDVDLGRKTAVYYLGLKNSLTYLHLIYFCGYLSELIAIVLGILPWTCLISFAFVPFQIKSDKIFAANPDKKTTFLIIIKNTALAMTIFVIGFAFGIFI